jgi:hypothetical protein
MNTRVMNRVAYRSVLLAGLCVAAACPARLGAQAPAPKAATAPGATTQAASTRTTAPTPSPKAVALAFVLSIDKGDATVAKALVPPGEGRARWVDAAVGLSAAVKRLDAAAVARFGEAGRVVSQGQLHLADSVKAVEQAAEKVEGEAATLTLGGSGRSVRLRKADGRWQMLVGPADDAEAAGQVALSERLARAADVTAGEIAAGGYADAGAAARGFAARVTEARLGV